MKILQVEAIIPNLIDCRAIERFLSDFEFNREHNRPDDENDINPPPHSRNVEFEENRSETSDELRPKKFDLSEPSVALRRDQRKIAIERELTQNRFGRCVAKFRDRIAVPKP